MCLTMQGMWLCVETAMNMNMNMNDILYDKWNKS